MEQPKKKKSPLPEFKMLASASSIGLSMVFSIFFGVAIGYYLDKKLDTRPWLLLVGLLVGVIAAFNNFYLLSKRLERQRTDIYGQDEDPKSDKRGPDKRGQDDGKTGDGKPDDGKPDSSGREGFFFDTDGDDDTIL
jgi:ATP synthase protein I